MRWEKVKSTYNILRFLFCGFLLRFKRRFYIGTTVFEQLPYLLAEFLYLLRVERRFVRIFAFDVAEEIP